VASNNLLNGGEKGGNEKEINSRRGREKGQLPMREETGNRFLKGDESTLVGKRGNGGGYPTREHDVSTRKEAALRGKTVFL